MCESYIITQTLADQDQMLNGKVVIKLARVIYLDAVIIAWQNRWRRKQESGPSYYPQKLSFNGYIDRCWGRAQIDRFIRAMYFTPFRGACVGLANAEEKKVSSKGEYDVLAASGQVGFR